MRSAPLNRVEPSLEERLAQLDQQLRRFETSLRTQQQSHVRARDLELELASVVQQGRAVVAELAGIGDQVRQAADAATRDALAESVGRGQEFERRGARILEAYGTAIRAAQQAVARAEARIDAFDERVARELAQAGRDIREAAAIIKDGQAKPVEGATFVSRWRSLLPALLAAALILGALSAYSLIARTLRDASSRAAAAERQAHEIQRDANQQIASMNRTAQQASADALAAAGRAERMFAVLASPDIQRIPMRGLRTASDASGQAVWSPSSRGVVITATRLPAVAANATYQVWLVTRQDSLNLGTAWPDAQGRINVYFEFPNGFTGNPWGFMLSVEPAGGSPRPSRAIVLAS